MPVVAAADFMSIMIRESVVDAGLLVKAAGGWEVIVLEKAEGQSLDKVKLDDLSQIKQVFKSLVQTVSYLHK